MKTIRRFVQDGQALTEGEWREWKESLGFDHNLAGNDTVATRAIEYARRALWFSDEAKRNHVEKYWPAVEKMMAAMVDHLRVDTLGAEDSPVPAIKVAVETVVPRIVEGLFGPGQDLFHVKGRDAVDRRRAEVIEEWLRYQVDLSEYTHWTEERVRSFLYYGICVVEASWEARYEWRTVRKHHREEEDDKDGVKQVVDVYESNYERVQVYNGCTARMVDPRDFVYDASQIDPDRAQFMGERTFMTVQHLLALEAEGYLSGVVDALKNEKGTSKPRLDDTTYMVTMRERHAALSDSGMIGYNWRTESADFLDPNSQALVPVVKLYVKSWTPKNEGVTVQDWDRWDFMFVNGYPCRIARMGLNSKLLPYAISRAYREPNKFWGESPVMDVLRPAAALDQLRASVQRGVMEAGTAPLVVPKSSDIAAATTAQMLPGQVIKEDLNKTGYLTRPVPINEQLVAAEAARRDIQQTIGAPDAISGTEQGGTATQNQNNLNEANRRIRSYVFRLSLGVDRGVLRRFLTLSQQFATERVVFRALGRHARKFRAGATLTPEMLDDPVDIVMLGPKTIEAAGQRATRAMSVLNQLQALLPTLIQDGSLRAAGIFREVWVNMMGYQPDDEFLRDDADPGDVLDPATENAILIQPGQSLLPHPLDNDSAHIRSHQIALRAAVERDVNSDVIEQMVTHIAAHEDQQRRKQAQAEARQAQAEAANMAAAQQIPQGRAKPQDGNTFSRAPDLGGSATAPAGQVNGPGTPGQAARMGRATNLTQTQNQ